MRGLHAVTMLVRCTCTHALIMYSLISVNVARQRGGRISGFFWHSDIGHVMTLFWALPNEEGPEPFTGSFGTCAYSIAAPALSFRQSAHLPSVIHSLTFSFTPRRDAPSSTPGHDLAVDFFHPRSHLIARPLLQSPVEKTRSFNPITRVPPTNTRT